MTYFIASDKKKPDIIQLLAKILHFTDQELDQVMTILSPVSIMCFQVMGTQRGWIASFWKRPDSTVPSTKVRYETNSSLTPSFSANPSVHVCPVFRDRVCSSISSTLTRSLHTITTCTISDHTHCQKTVTNLNYKTMFVQT